MKNMSAQEIVIQATDRLAAEQPLHAGILAQWKTIEDNTIPTMAIGYCRGRLLLLFNPFFIRSVTLDELAAVLSHEANHVLFGHCTRAPAEDENSAVMTIAAEVTVNEWVAGSLPGEPVVLRDYPLLPPNEDTLTRYDRLLAILPAGKDTLDDHSHWAAIRASEHLAGALIATTIAKAWKALTPVQKAQIRLPDMAKANIEAAVESTTRAELELIGVGRPSIPWQQVLRKAVGRSLSKRSVFTKPPRRFPEMVGIFPGRARQSAKPRIMAVIDTSGSMSSSSLAAISAELDVMAKGHAVIVVECDCQIREVYPYRPIQQLSGRGGTDFRPVFEAPFLQQHRPDLLVYFTDGHGVVPAYKPKIPTIWCLTPYGQHPCVWGAVVRISSG